MALRSIRVTHIVSGDLWGGAEAFVYALAEEQQRQSPGNVSCVVMNPGRLADELQRAGITTEIMDETRASTWQLASNIARHVRSFQPDVVHAHRHKENFLALLATQQARCRVGRVTTVHGLSEPVHRGNKARAALKNLVNRAVLNYGFDAVVGVSRDIAARLQSTFRRTRALAIHNGVTVPRSAPPKIVTTDRPLHLVALGRLVPIKRFERLKDLYFAISNSPIGPARITLAGDGPLMQTLRQSFAAETQIAMPGFVANTASLLDEADGLVMTSDHEGIPMSALEALARGIPVFGFAVGGLPEIAAPSLPLHLAQPYDTQALANSIVEFFSRNAPGVRITPPANWSFDIRTCADRYSALYLQVLHSPPHRSAR